MHPTAVADFAPPLPWTRRDLPAASVAATRPRRGPGASGLVQRRLAFLLPLVVSVPVAWRLVLHYHSIYNDALSRLANGYYVFYSRDPHLSSVGFVWNPLPSLIDLPLLLVKGFWPVLATDAFASNLMSCAFFALACYQLYRYFEDLRLGAVTRWGLWLCFAANPLVFYYGVNGMSEMLFLLTLVVVVRFLTQWVQTGRTRSLVVSGLWLGIAYVARNEAAAAALLATPLVSFVSYVRAEGDRSWRRRVALTDSVLFAAPFALSFVLWAALSWIIVGHPFEQLSSVYGNASQVRSSGSAGAGFHLTTFGRFEYAVRGSQSVAPLLAVGCLLGLARGFLRRDARVLVAVTVFVGVLAFEIVAFSLNQIFPWYRYYIYADPALVMVCACLAAPSARAGTGPSMQVVGRSVVTFGAAQMAAALGALALVLAAPGLLTTAHTLGTVGGVSQQDRDQLAYILWPHAADATYGHAIQASWAGVSRLSRQLDALHLAHGAIMVDNFTSCIPQLLLDSAHPRQYTIPNDQDYQEKLGVPYQFGIRYFLVPDSRTNPVDALNRQFPGLYDTGQGLATMTRQISIPNCPTFRLYKVLPGAGK